MKQCDRGLSPLAIGSSSSSLSFAASESDPEDSFWRDFTFDFSFLTSDDHKIGLDDGVNDDSRSNFSRHANATTLPKVAEESELYGLNPNAFGRKRWPVRDQSFDIDIRRGENSDKLTSTLDSDFKCLDSRTQVSPSGAVVKSSAVANTNSGDTEGACSGNIVVSKVINESNTSPVFSKMPDLRIKKCSSGSGIDKLNLRTGVLSEEAYIPVDQDDTEVDSPCWKGIQSRNTAASGTKSWNFRRSKDDLNGFHRLNPLAPQFIPSSAKRNLDNHGKVSEENGFSSSLKRSLSSTFPPSSGEFSIINTSEAGIEQDSGENNRLGILFHDADESLGLVSQDSVSNTMSILDISNQFQKPTKLDPLAPVFVPANAKVSAVIHVNHSAADHTTSTETTTRSAFSSSDNGLLNSVKIERYSSEVDSSFRNRYSNSVHESGTTYSFKPRLGYQVQISENTKLDSSSSTFHGQKKLNPLAPQFSLADIKQNVHASLAQSSRHLEPYFNEVDTTQMGLLSPNTSHRNSSLLSQSTMEIPPFHNLGTATSLSSHDVKALSDSGQRYACSTSSASPKMDVKKLLATIHGLSELLIHVNGSESSDSPNEQDLNLINCTVQNLNSYVNNRVEEHSGSYASEVHSSYDSKLLPNMRKQSLRDQLPKVRNVTHSTVSREMMVPVSHFDYGVGKIMVNHPTEEQINPQVLFYKSLWLKAKADRSLMEYETFLSKTK